MPFSQHCRNCDFDFSSNTILFCALHENAAALRTAAINVSEEYGDVTWHAPFGSEREMPLQRFIGELRDAIGEKVK